MVRGAGGETHVITGNVDGGLIICFLLNERLCESSSSFNVRRPTFYTSKQRYDDIDFST